MKIGRPVQLPSKAAARFVVLLLTCLAAIALAAACGGEEGGTATPGGTRTATVTATARPAGTVTPAGPVPGISDTEILLGAEVILSGTFGAVYATLPKSTNAYFNYINDTEGGVCGRKIVYKMEDNRDDPAVALEVARKLVEQDKVFAMVGSLGDTPHPASWEYLNDNGVPDILVSAGGHRFGADPKGHPWTVQMIPSYYIEGTFFGQYISQNLPGKKVAALWENDPVGIDGLPGLKRGLDPNKNQLVADENYEVTSVSIASQVANLKKSNAEVVVLFSSPVFTAQAISNADRLGWHPQWLMSYINSDDMMFQFVSPELLKGAITFQALKLAAWTDDPAVARHAELMKKYDGPTPTNFTIYAQALAEVAVDVLKRSCDNLTREGLMEAVESTKDFHSDLLLDGINISFSDTDHTALQTAKMLQVTVTDGKGKFEYFGPIFEFQP
ncbi:MAG: ABC transporter substrate-binding protein [Chloroflexota bacterium]|nr:ABC transporter substrate-binding protein [Chloroflexota bacterium]